MRHVSLVALSALGAGLASGACAAEEAMATAGSAPGVQEVVVFGRGEQRIGSVRAASEGSLAGADLTVRPILRTGEILEAVPGMIVTQHSGSGKANQYFLRGFNLDHGADFGLTIDDVPMNLRTHGHGQGYLDINGLIPETVKRIDYRKGPYRADLGDFNLVGGGQITTVDTFAAPFASAEYGRYDYVRLGAGGSWDVADGDLLLAAQYKTYDGPWALAEDLRHFAIYGKFGRDTPLGRLRVNLSVYDATWRPTEQIPDRAIGVLVPDAYGSLDRDLKGHTEREILAAQLDGGGWYASAYVQHYDWKLISNFTFFLEDPVNGDQLEQSEKLWTYGGRLARTLELDPKLTIVVGGEARHDDLSDIGLYQTVGGRRFATKGRFAIQETSGALYAEATWKPTDRLTLFGGLRGDAYRFEADARSANAWSGVVHDSIVSPKIGVTYAIGEGIALYGNWGEGFHSNDARGVTEPTAPAPGLVKGRGHEVGARFERFGLVATATYWWFDVDSELIYVGDAGAVEPSSASVRRGYELTVFYRPTDWLALDAVWTGSHARFTDSPGANHIPGALEHAGEAGVAVIRKAWNVGARLRFLGSGPLIEDDSVRSNATTIVNLRAAWTPGRYEVYGELLNAFDSRKKDIQYYYPSRLPGEPLEGFDDIHSRVVEPRMVRAGMKVRF